MRAWRAAHPGYWRRRRQAAGALPDVLNAQAPPAQGATLQDGGIALPDVLPAQAPLLVGLIAQLTGAALPEDIAVMTTRLVARGQAAALIMKIEKHLLLPERLRRCPAQFSFVDHQLVRGGFLPRASAPAWALYLVLVTVGDERG